MIGYGNSLMTPTKGGVNNFLGRNNSIHLRHIRVEMQLDTLLGSVVHTLKNRNLLHSNGREEGLVIKLILLDSAKDGKMRAGLQPLDPIKLLIGKSFLNINCGCTVGDADGAVCLIACTGLLHGNIIGRAKENSSPMRLCRIGKRCGIDNIKVLAIDRLGFLKAVCSSAHSVA